jgi:hypothetical protein
MARMSIDNLRVLYKGIKSAFVSPVAQPGEGLKPTSYPMPEPENYDAFYDQDPLSRRRIAICNLYANHHKSIPEIIHLLEASPKLVIDTLIENQLLKDRRRVARPRTPAPEELKAQARL